MKRTDFPFLGFGIGLRRDHYAHVIENRPAMDWFEIISENFMVGGGRPLEVIDEVAARYPVVMHGVSLSIGSTDPLNRDYLRDLKALAKRIKPAWISDHLCWSGVGGRNLHDLLPLPYTPKVIAHVAARIRIVQDFLERPIVLENVSSYMAFRASSMSEWEFISTIAEQADSGILLDINNVYVSAFNHGFDPAVYVDSIPIDRVVQYHLAGHSDHGTYLLDTHDHPVCDAVWSLYEHAVRRFGAVSTLIEWDDNLPEFERLSEAAERAREIHNRVLAARHSDAIRSRLA